ncbi:MAG: response regulator [Bacteroidales bacterium]|nr:response regulator [Bacteroidales bacterium]MBQ6726224.1 response regulator [Bacteroidales bacterium]
MTEGIIVAVITAIGVILAAFVGGVLKKKNNKKQEQQISQNQTQNVTVNNFLGEKVEHDSNDEKKDSSATSNLKLKLQILFIDDEKFKMMENIKKAGWQNVSYKKDITNLDDPAILKAHIVFVDINGVGQNLFPKNQGIGLAAAIKNKYSQKQVCIYSAEPHMLDPDLKKVDYTLQKNAEPIQFYNFIEEFGHKCFNE